MLYVKDTDRKKNEIFDNFSLNVNQEFSGFPTIYICLYKNLLLYLIKTFFLL